MTDSSSSPFSIYLGVEEQPEDWWWAAGHSVLRMEEDCDADQNVSDAVKLVAHRWRVGVMSRVALQLLHELKNEGTAVEHGCASRYGREDKLGDCCGLLIADQLINQTEVLAKDEMGHIGIIVPDSEANRWRDRAQALIREVVTSDATPLPTTDARHAPVVLVDPEFAQRGEVTK